MSWWCFSEPCTVAMHYTLKIQCLFHWDMRKGRERDEGVWGIQDFSSWNSLQNHFPPQDNTTWSLLSLNVMKAALSSGENIFTWQHKSRPGADERTVDSVARHTQWACHGSSPKKSKKSTQTPLKCHQVWEHPLLHYCNGVLLTKQTQLS